MLPPRVEIILTMPFNGIYPIKKAVGIKTEQEGVSGTPYMTFYVDRVPLICFGVVLHDASTAGSFLRVLQKDICLIVQQREG